MLFLLLQNVSRRDEHSSRLHKPPQHQSLFFEAEEVLQQQQRTRTPGQRRVCCQRQERAQQAQSSLSVPGSAEGQSPDPMGAAGPLGYSKSHGTLLTTYSTVLDAQMPPHACSASCFTTGFHAEQGFSQGFVSDPHQAALRVISNPWEQLVIVTPGQKAGKEVSVVSMSCAGHHSSSQFAVQRSSPRSGTFWELWQSCPDAGTDNPHLGSHSVACDLHLISIPRQEAQQALR